MIEMTIIAFVIFAAFFGVYAFWRARNGKKATPQTRPTKDVCVSNPR